MKVDHFINIQGWMLDLGLTLAERTVYALIHGITYDGVHEFRGSMEYIGEWCGLSSRSIRRILGTLVERGLVLREDSPGQISTFRVNRDFIPEVQDKMSPRTNWPPPSDKMSVPTPDNLSPHKNNRENNREIIDTHSSPRTREDNKVLYGDYVRLTEAEHSKLVTEFGKEDAARLIDILDLYLANKPKDPYKSHYAAIRKWCVRDLAEQKTAEQRLKNAQQAQQRIANNNGGLASGYGEQAMANARRLEELLKN